MKWLTLLIRSQWEWVIALSLTPLVFILSQDYGMAWDDAQHAIYGAFVKEYFASGFADDKWRTHIGLLYVYGTLFDLPSAMIHGFFGEDIFKFRPFLMALTGVLAIPAVAKIGRKLGGERAAVYSVLCLILMPSFVGQSFINCKDLPMATAVAWTLLAGMKLIERPSLGNYLLCGLLAGLTMSIRVGGVIALIILAGVAAFIALRHFLLDLPAENYLRSTFISRHLGGVAFMLLLAWAVTVSIWPYAHKNPLINPIDAFRLGSSFPIEYPVLYFGAQIPSSKLPWHYLPVMIGLTTPLPILIPAVAGIFSLLARFLVKWKSAEALHPFLILFWIGFPLAYVILAKPNIYDGIRHFLFLLPPLACCSGLAISQLESALRRVWKPSSIALPLALLAASLPNLIVFHPYQYSYFNFLAGERKTLHERFETDYWTTSYKEAAKEINAIQKEHKEPLAVAVGANALSIITFGHYADPKIKLGFFIGESGKLAFPKEADYIVTTPRYGMWRNFQDGELVHEIRRGGILMCTIRKNIKSPEESSNGRSADSAITAPQKPDDSGRGPE